ncbi:MAG: hypothetical protein ACXU86_22335, partial [Archangium sp.]
MRRIFQIALLAALAVSSNALAAGARKSSGTRKSTRASKKPPEEATPPEASKPVEETRPSVEPKPLEPAVKPDAPVRPDAAVVPARPEGEKTPSAPVSTAWEWIGSHVRLRQSLEDKNQAAKPAAFQLTFPSDGKPVSLNVDAGLKMVGVLLPADTGSSQLEGSLGAEYHQKTDIAQPQNLLAVGAGLEWVLSPRLQESSNPDVLVANTVHDLQLNAQFKSDFGQNTQSVQAYLDYVPINFLYSGLIFPSRVKAGGSRWIAFSWLPTLGIEGEDVLPSAAGATGWLLRARGALDVSVYPAPDLFDQR